MCFQLIYSNSFQCLLYLFFILSLQKRHRLRGKRVRNLMGFLKGCSDCQNPETSSIDSCQIPETETTNTRSIPSIRVISDPSPTTSYRKNFNNSQNYK